MLFGGAFQSNVGHIFWITYKLITLMLWKNSPKKKILRMEGLAQNGERSSNQYVSIYWAVV